MISRCPNSQLRVLWVLDMIGSLTDVPMSETSGFKSSFTGLLSVVMTMINQNKNMSKEILDMIPPIPSSISQIDKAILDSINHPRNKQPDYVPKIFKPILVSSSACLSTDLVTVTDMLEVLAQYSCSGLLAYIIRVRE